MDDALGFLKISRHPKVLYKINRQNKSRRDIFGEKRRRRRRRRERMVSRRGMLEVTMVSASCFRTSPCWVRWTRIKSCFLEREDAHENRQERRFQSGVERDLGKNVRRCRPNDKNHDQERKQNAERRNHRRFRNIFRDCFQTEKTRSAPVLNAKTRKRVGNIRVHHGL